VLVAVLFGVCAASAITLLSTPQYESSSQAFVSVRDSGDTVTADANQIQNANQASQFSIERVKSYVNVVDSSSVTSAVVKSLQLPMTPAQLSKRITVSAPQDTVLIDISVRDPSPRRAQQIAAALDQAFAQTVADLESSPGVTSPVSITFVRQPTVPTEPKSPRATVNLALGLIAGLMLGLGSAVARDGLDTSVKTTAELETLAGGSPLGSVPDDPGCRAAPVPSGDRRDTVRGESYERLRANLHFVPVPPRSLVVTSAVDGEGKTVTAANVALILARVGVRVALVEADLRRPRLTDYLGLPPGLGLSEVLTGHATLDRALRRWGGEELPLWVLTSGALPASPNELLCSDQMLDTLVTLSERVDVVLIDTPALLTVSDAAILAKLTDGAVVVVRAGKTNREQLSMALTSLAALDAKVYGTVLNRVHRWSWATRSGRRRPTERPVPPIRHAERLRTGTVKGAEGERALTAPVAFIETSPPEPVDEAPAQEPGPDRSPDVTRTSQDTVVLEAVPEDGSKTGPKAGSKAGSKTGSKAGSKTGPEAGSKTGPEAGTGPAGSEPEVETEPAQLGSVIGSVNGRPPLSEGGPEREARNHHPNNGAR
jgi:capsular exopolysaccharide synthesis family protein